MKFYSFWRSLGAFRVRIALNLKGIVPDEVISVDLMKGEQRAGGLQGGQPRRWCCPRWSTATGRSCSSRSPSWNTSTRRTPIRRSCRRTRAAAPACARWRRSWRRISLPADGSARAQLHGARPQARRGRRATHGSSTGSPKACSRSKGISRATRRPAACARRCRDDGGHLPRQPGRGRRLLRRRGRARIRTSSASRRRASRWKPSPRRIRCGSPARLRARGTNDAQRRDDRPRLVGQGTGGARSATAS